MKRKKSPLSLVLFLIALFLLILIDMPANLPIKFQLGKFKMDRKTKPLALDISLFGLRLKKEFRTHLGLDLQGGSHLVYEADILRLAPADVDDALAAARDIIEKRVNFFGISEPTVQTVRSGRSRRIVVDLPGIQNTTEALFFIGQTAQLDFRESASSSADVKTATETSALARLTQKTGLTGKHIKKSTVQFDQNTGKPVVALAFTDEGAKLFEKITKKNVGQPVGIFLDQFLLSAPVVQQVITGGEAVISGDFTVDTAKKLSVSINAGALPLPINLKEMKTIGPTLGAEQVRRSLLAGLVGLAGVVIFMMVYYGVLGVIASAALLIYGLLTLALFRAIPVVLTLSGMAGFILSIGMAVDANILIFERIKEERRRGKKFEAAVRIGFGRALTAIKDANLTTLLVAFILFNPLNWSFFPQFGLVKGFALTLGIGVIASLFTGVVITRRLIEMFYQNPK